VEAAAALGGVLDGTREGVVRVELTLGDGPVDAGVGLLDDPIVWEVEDGWITEIRGGAEADRLRAYVDEFGDENAMAFAEFAMVTNPAARPNGNYFENKFVGGGVHMALGDNTSYGGPHSSSIHLDGVQTKPTVTVDGETVIRDGTMLFG
jgi:leucyl aminopeptidase (aminopeptidase T)